MLKFANLLTKKTAQPTAQLLKTLPIQSLSYPHIQLDNFARGIDNFHIDIFLSSQFINTAHTVIHDLLDERTSTKRRFSDKPSPKVMTQFEQFSEQYTSLLKAAIHRAKEKKNISSIQLFQISVIKFILTTTRYGLDKLVHELRNKMLNNNSQTTQLYERTTWINKYKNKILSYVTYEVFEQLRWVESGAICKLRESLLGVTWAIPEKMFFNPLLQNTTIQDSHTLLEHYVYLPQEEKDNFTFTELNNSVEKLLDTVLQKCNFPESLQYRLFKISDDDYDTENTFSWKDVPENIQVLFSYHMTEKQADHTPELHDELSARLHYQKRFNELLVNILEAKKVIPNILAAYEVPHLYEHYAKLLSPDYIYNAILGNMDMQAVEYKLQMELKIRPLRRPTDKPLTIQKLNNTVKKIKKQARQDNSELCVKFLTDFIRYRRDLKYYRVMTKSLERVNLLLVEDKAQLSRANGILHEFLLEDEYPEQSEGTIRGHVIIKADLRGSTTITSELRRRGLNPATHFSLNFFNPIRELLPHFNAEKVFIEGDAIILSVFEYDTQPEHWLAVARASGLAKNILDIVAQQNKLCKERGLPLLELGIGICYVEEEPTFLYDGEQRIMISSAIGDADRLSSCSWKLRRKYEYDNKLLTNVMVFKQAMDDKFKGEKGMTTFRYNLNGIELSVEGFEKLKGEIALRSYQLRLPKESQYTRFYAGVYPDVSGRQHKLVIREGYAKIWREDSEEYLMTDQRYYEVVTNSKLLKTIYKAM